MTRFAWTLRPTMSRKEGHARGMYEACKGAVPRWVPLVALVLRTGVAFTRQQIWCGRRRQCFLRFSCR